jgi:ribosomal 30S subunit maturation factor RimM
MLSPSTPTARCLSLLPTATLLPRCRASKPTPPSTPRAVACSHNTSSVTGRKSHSRPSSTALGAAASDAIEIDDDDDGSSSTPSSPPSTSSAAPPSDLVEVATFGAPHGVRGEVRIFPVTDEPEERLLEEGARFWVAPQLESGRGGGSGGKSRGILIGRGSSSAPAAAAAPKPRLVRIEAARPAPISRSSKKGSSSSSSAGSSSWLLKLRGIDSPEAAAALANNSLWVSAAERPALPEAGDDFYAQELIGMEARLLGGEGGRGEKVVGIVVDVCGGGGTDLLRLELSDDEGAEEEVEEVEEVEVEGAEASTTTATTTTTTQRQRRRGKTPPSLAAAAARRTVLLPFTQAFVPHVDRGARRMTICPPDGLLDLAILPPKAQLKQQEEEARAAAAATASGGSGGGGGGSEGGEAKKQSKPRRPRGRKARDRAGGGTAAPPSA